MVRCLRLFSSLRQAARQVTIGLSLAAASLGVPAQERHLVMASTTSTDQSGLFGHLLPAFKAATGISVRVVALGTGQALDMGRRGDADLLFVHDPVAEEKFVADGFGLKRLPVMVNDLVIVGPRNDPAGAAGKDVTAALTKIAATRANFISRGDKSGTHAAELRHWNTAKVDMAAGGKPAGYKECGCGMGPALNMAASLNAYVLSDRGTWLSFKNRGQLKVLVEGDPRLLNPYAVMMVNPALWPHVKKREAQAFIDWVVSPAGQARIAAYKIGGEQLFFPLARQ